MGSLKRGYKFYLFNGRLAFGAYNGIWLLSRVLIAAQVVPPQTWTHVAVSVKRNAPRGVVMYVNGDQVATSHSFGIGLMDNDADLFIGKESTSQGNFFDGRIDELEILNRALQPYEVYDLYAAGALGKCK